MIKVKIIADSLAPSNIRLTTFVLIYPRFIHSEFMTHRVFSRNSSSSRAIPVVKQIEEIKANPAIPLIFKKNKQGMQGGEPIEKQDAAIEAWLSGCNKAIEVAEQLIKMDVHKQHVNRILEPFAHITVVVTATSWDNFFALRYHPDAQPEIYELAKQMWKIYSTNKAENLEEGKWHLPFINEQDYLEISSAKNTSDPKILNKILIKRSVARCARVSYKNHNGTNATIEQDERLYKLLIGNSPVHASPAEHQAMAIGDPKVHSGNLRGWIQYRKTLEGESISKFNSL